MRASRILRHICASTEDEVHPFRRRLMLGCVDALVRGGKLSLTELGRLLAPSTSPKHRIKRVDRFLGNPRARADVPVWYRALARYLLGKNRRPVVQVDWTQTHGEFYALVAAVAFDGRAMPLYAEVHHKRKLNNRAVVRRFLQALSSVLGPHPRPIVVADGGFRTPFFHLVDELGWDFVIRLRGRGVMRRWSENPRHKDPKLAFRDAFSMATSRPQRLGLWKPRSYPAADDYSIVLGTKPSRRRTKGAGPYHRRWAEPWLLATTLDDEPAERIVALYATRMQIEESFRDTKNARLGWAFEHAASRSPQRQALLLLIACLAFACAMLTGAALERTGTAIRFQANTIRNRRVCSLFRLGVFVLAYEEATALTPRLVFRERDRVLHFRRSHKQLFLPLTRRKHATWF